ncbi:MAG: histidine kinase [Rhodocyclaceae bacterium]|nr:MAG: histidine kinase [Rhodocyclaceae bacterium]
MSSWGIVLAALGYLALLFFIAYKADRRADAGRSVINSPSVYALSLAVYCTTWTYYGSVGRAATSGINFLPVYLGPTLLFTLGGVVLQKIIRVVKANRITSIADFIASRYGKSHLIGGLVTVIAVIGIVPYIALQLKAVSSSFDLLARYPLLIPPLRDGSLSFLTDSALYVALALAAFTIVFGTRHLDATERHEGMVAAIAAESLVKLLAFLAVGIYVTYGIHNGFADVFNQARGEALLDALRVNRDSAASYGGWFSLTLLAMLAALLLPRQFQITVIENVNEDHLRRAMWMFPAYLFAINIFVLPITFSGVMEFGLGLDTDTFVLTLPMAHHLPWLALLVFLGGLAAATGMVIVETIALSTMVCNDLVMPVLLRLRPQWLQAKQDLTGLLLNIRRGAIVLILLLGYLYFRLAGEAYALVAIGLISFAAVVQFGPVLLGGLYWKGGTRPGALAGLIAGFGVWTYTLLLPSFAKSGWLSETFLTQGPWQIALLRPQQLLGLTGLDEITHCLIWSMLANMGAYIAVSLLRMPNAIEAEQAIRFVDNKQSLRPGNLRASAADLLPLASRFLGADKANEAFTRYAQERGVGDIEALPADADLTYFAETLLAGAIGSASARVMIATVTEEGAPVGIDEVLHILDEASQIRAYSHQLEEQSKDLERASLELRAANERLQELDRLKDDFISTVTHELRTPLTAIRAFAEILHSDPKADIEDRKRFLGIILVETERLSRLINQILDLAKLESGSGGWRIGPLDISDAVHAAINAISQLAQDKRVALEEALHGPFPIIQADGDRLIQVLINLLSNAVKFVPAETGRIKVEAFVSDKEIRVAVADNGPGIRPEDQEIIFEKFRQGGGNILTGKPEGTGLGLPISRQIVTHFGGRLWVESQLGQGATFFFTLPRTAEETAG